uniref:Uncharacterized protein n=1 Tax=Eutreptiella gymnastica TaxID=73025 RepID=A0A7S4FTW1_9EUGL
MVPEGMEGDVQRGVELRNEATGASVLVMHTRLFGDGGEGELDGHALDAVYVVGAKEEQHLVWKKVEQPPLGSNANVNRYGRLQRLLQQAKIEAVLETEGYF